MDSNHEETRSSGISKLLIRQSTRSQESHGCDLIRTAFVQSDADRIRPNPPYFARPEQMRVRSRVSVIVAKYSECQGKVGTRAVFVLDEGGETIGAQPSRHVVGHVFEAEECHAVRSAADEHLISRRKALAAGRLNALFQVSQRSARSVEFEDGLAGGRYGG